MQSNKKKHLDLLKYSQKLESEGKNIYDESEKDFFALREYSIMLTNHLHWENREHYFEVKKRIERIFEEMKDGYPLDKE